LGSDAYRALRWRKRREQQCGSVNRTAPFTAIFHIGRSLDHGACRDLCSELIGKIDFSDYFFLLLMGEMPNDNQRFFVNALLVAIAEHGLVRVCRPRA